MMKDLQLGLLYMGFVIPREFGILHSSKAAGVCQGVHVDGTAFSTKA